MELLYLYIEEFKSIQQQEFLLTPDYDISYKSKKLEINKKESGLPDKFFGERIGNIHAIIGQNGSGKSSLLEFIVAHTSGSSIAWKYMAIFVFRDNEELYILKNLQLDVTTHVVHHDYSLYDYENGFFVNYINPIKLLNTVYYSNYYDGELKDFQNQQLPYLMDISTNYVQNLRERFDYSYYAQKNELPSEKEKNDYTKKAESYSFRSFEVDKQIDLISKLEIGEILEFPLPDYIEISLYPVRGIQQMIIHLRRTGRFNMDLAAALEKFESLFTESAYHEFIKAIFYSKWIAIISGFHFKTSFGAFTNLIYQIIKEPKKVIDEKWLFNQFSFGTDIKQYQRIITALKKLEKYKSSNNTYVIPKSKQDLKIASNFNTIINNAFLNIDNPIKFDWFFNNSNRKGGLSSGEKAMLSFYSRLHYAERSYFTNDLILVIDEGDLGLHPEWQRKFIYNLVNQGSSIVRPRTPSGNPIQVIITSHSPFLASDLPNSNITYLERKDGKCHVIERENDRNSFAANISVLLHEKYFLEGAFLSEFAKKKIEKVISTLKEYRGRLEDTNKVKTEEDIYTQEEAKQIIDLIGEPVLHERLLNEYLSIFKTESRLTNKEKIKELEDQIKKLKEES